MLKFNRIYSSRLGYNKSSPQKKKLRAAANKKPSVKCVCVACNRNNEKMFGILNISVTDTFEAKLKKQSVKNIF